jgi:hypothetical protein
MVFLNLVERVGIDCADIIMKKVWNVRIKKVCEEIRTLIDFIHKKFINCDYLSNDLDNFYTLLHPYSTLLDDKGLWVARNYDGCFWRKVFERKSSRMYGISKRDVHLAFKKSAACPKRKLTVMLAPRIKLNQFRDTTPFKCVKKKWLW